MMRDLTQYIDDLAEEVRLALNASRYTRPVAEALLGSPVLARIVADAETDAEARVAARVEAALWTEFGGLGDTAPPTADVATMQERVLPAVRAALADHGTDALAAHDAEVRAEAWDEGHEEGCPVPHGCPAHDNPYRALADRGLVT